MKNQIEKKLNRNVSLDYMYTFLNNLNMSGSVWVLYLAYRGMNLLQIGILEGIFHVTSMLFEIPSGAVADLLGRKKTLAAGRICIALSCVVMLFAGGFTGFALSFVIQALGYNLNSGSEEALVYDSMKLCGREKEYLKINGRLNVLVEAASAASTVAGGILAEYSYTWCYATCFVIALLGLLPLLAMTEPPILERGVKEPLLRLFRKHFGTSLSVLKEKKEIRKIVIYYSAVFVAYTLLFFYSQQYFNDLGLNKIEIGMIMLLAGGVSCLGAVSSEKVFGILGERVVVAASTVIGLCFVGFGYENVTVAAAALLTASYFNSVLYPIQSISLNRLIPSKQRATLISVNSMAFSVGMALLFPVAGALADRFGLPQVFLAMGVMLTVGTLAVWYPQRPGR